MTWFDRLMEPGLWTDASRPRAERVEALLGSGDVAPAPTRFRPTARGGAASDDIRGEGKFRLTGDLRVVGHDRVLTTPCAIQRDADHEG